MNIERAFCVEKATVVDIYAARDLYFRQVPPRRRFQFLCSDEQCRAINGTKVTGVNYDKLVEEVDQYVRPHFRENTDHIPDCEWMELEIALRELKEERWGRSAEARGEESSSRSRRARKSSNIVDIFLPAASEESKRAVSAGRIPHGKRAEVNKIPTQRGRIAALKDHLRKNPNQTHNLEDVVDSYLTLAMDERKVVRLKIGGCARRSFWRCFRHLKFYEQGADEEFIYYGGAWAKQVKSNFSLRFYSRVRFGEEERLVSLYIEREKLDQYQHRAYLLEFLEKLVSRESPYATCYFYGRFVPSKNNNAFLDVKLNYLGNLVLRLK